MKTTPRTSFLLEFGDLSGAQNAPQAVSIDLPSQALAQSLTSGLVRVFSHHIDLGAASTEDYWKLSSKCPKASWVNPQFFISLTRVEHPGIKE